jgi:hypothetical protein
MFLFEKQCKWLMERFNRKNIMKKMKTRHKHKEMYLSQITWVNQALVAQAWNPSYKGVWQGRGPEENSLGLSPKKVAGR